MKIRPRTHRTGAVLVTTVLAVLAVLAGRSASNALQDFPAAAPTTTFSRNLTASTGRSAGPVRIVLRFGDEVATGTLMDTPVARNFAAMLPLDLDVRDPMGQAKSGPLPSPLDMAGADPVFDPQEGQLYYSATGSMFAIFYDDLGQSIPPPGLIRLGVVDSGLPEMATAGNDFDVRVELVDDTAS